MTFLVVEAAQDGPQSVKTIEDVKVGMPRSLVLSGLAKKYELRKEDESNYWLVSAKDADKFERAEIWFVEDKVWGVYVYMYPPMTGEAVKLMERLFFLLNDRAKIAPSNLKILQDPSLGSSVASAIANRKHLDLSVDLFYHHYDSGEKMEIDLSVEKEHFAIVTWKSEGFPSDVEVEKIMEIFAERQDK